MNGRMEWMDAFSDALGSLPWLETDGWVRVGKFKSAGIVREKASPLLEKKGGGGKRKKKGGGKLFLFLFPSPLSFGPKHSVGTAEVSG